MCYDISTRLQNIRRLYMYDKLCRHGWPPHKSCMADSIIFEIEDDFRTPFESAIGRSACGWAYVQRY